MFTDILMVSLSTILVMALLQFVAYMMTTRVLSRPSQHEYYYQPQQPQIVYQPPPQQQQQPIFPPQQPPSQAYQPVLTQPTVNTQETNNLSYEDLVRQATPTTSSRMDAQLPNGIQETFTRQ